MTGSDGDTVLFHDIPVDLQPAGGAIIAYKGEFDTPPSGTIVVPGMSYLLTCSDGRSGTIIIKGTHSWSNQGFRVEFETTGPFE
jgi:hypothetical protein